MVCVYGCLCVYVMGVWVYGLCECMGAWVYVGVWVLWVSGCMNGVGVCG